MSRLDQQMAFLTEVDRLKSVVRATTLCDASRFENSAEHSWHIALYALVLAEHAETQLRSEEHTSELQSPVPISYAVFCLKKKKHNT